MYCKTIACALLIWVLFPVFVTGQVYVGNILLNTTMEYAKIIKEGDSWVLQFPIKNDTKTAFEANPFAGKGKIIFNGDCWDLEKVGNHSNGFDLKIENVEGNQVVRFYLQNKPINDANIQEYVGMYVDDSKNISIIKNQFGRLQVISPYSGETVFLKPVGEGVFWSSSGELWRYDDSKNRILHSTLNGKESNLSRQELFEIKEVWIPHNKDTLFGKYFVPRTNEKMYPACLMLQGGGAAGLDNYMYESTFLAAHGVAVLLCNKSGEGRSKGESNFNLQTFDEKVLEYNALFEYLRSQPNVNKEKVGVHGISEGGRLAIQLSAYNQGVAFVMAGAAPIMTLIKGQIYAMSHYHRDMNIDEETNLEIQNIWKRYYQDIIAEKIDSSNIENANRLRKKGQNLFLPPNSFGIPGSPRKEDLLSSKILDEIDQIESPVLLQYGENDHRVNPYKSLGNFERLIDDSVSWKAILYPRSNHSFMTPEYQIATHYLRDKLVWLKTQQIID
ncbi:MAG: prolyl oligopeptidase family serine peptidase [Bacteroidota bacterium]